jgi:lysophospholipase L1-like esterase
MIVNIIRASFCLVLVFLATSAIAQLAPADPWEADIARFEQADRIDPPKPGSVLFIGSSSIRFWDSIETDFPDTRIIRRGFGGSEIRDATHFAGRIVVPYKPRLIVLYAGDNDLAAGRASAQVAADFTAFVERVRRDLPTVAIAYIAIKPSPSRTAFLDASRDANALIRSYAATQADIRYIDIFTPMLDAGGKPRRELFGHDMLHMNRAGYEVWISQLAPILREFPTR